MPDQKIRQIMTATDPADVATMAMIECVRQLADNGKVTNKLLEGMGVELKDVRERVIRIEAGEYKGSIEKVDKRHDGLELRVDKLEAADILRQGERNAANWLFKNWPGIVAWFGMLAAVLIANGRIHL